MTQTDERWYVQFDSKEVRLMTLEELDQAFEGGAIHENTYLIRVGETEWQTLRDVAGLSEDDEPEAVPEPAPAPVAAAHPGYAAPAHNGYATQAHNGYAAAPARSMAPPATAAAVGGWPPVAAAAPVAARPLQQNFASNLPSTIPVVSDLDFDISAQSFKSGKRTLAFVAFAAVAVIGGGGYALTRLDQLPPPPPAVAAAPLAVAPQPVAAPPPPTPTPVAAPAATEPSSDGSSGRLSDDMKRALLAQDGDRAAKKATKKATRATAARPSSKTKPAKGVFRAGGSDSDPLNSAL